MHRGCRTGRWARAAGPQMRSRSWLFLVANSSSERMPRRRRSSSSMSRCRISEGGVPGGVAGPRRRGGTARGRNLGRAARRRHRRAACRRARHRRVLVGVGGPVPIVRLHVGRDRLAAAAADDLVDLRVDDALDHRRLAHVLQGQRVVLALHVDDQRAGPEHPLDQALADVDLGDALQAQLDRVAPDDALAHEDPGRGERHHVGAPADEPAEQPQAGDEGQDQDRVVRPARRVLPQDEQHDEGRPHPDGREERPEQEDPVRPQLGQQLLVLVEELPRQGHRASVPAVTDRPGAR